LPHTIDGYEIIETLGTGALGVTYRARDTRTDTLVALKVFHPHLVEFPGVAARLRNEARAAAYLYHPNVARVLDHGEAGGAVFVASELVEGPSLRWRLQRDGRLPETETQHIALGITHALNAATAHRIVHRDLKPENVVLGDDGRVVVTDFGQARAMDAVTLTQVVAFGAASPYAAPEVGEGRGGIRSDLYALGVMMFEMLTGQLPVRAGQAVTS
jgi:serine/threonine-protein kinase